MAGDLPVGQQSKGSSKRPPLVGPLDVEEDAPSLPSMGRVTGKVKIFTEEGWAAVVARVRAQVAEEIAQALSLLADEYRDKARVAEREDQRRSCVSIAVGVTAAMVVAREHGAAPAESVVAALPDVVGTPDHPEAPDVNIPPSWTDRCSAGRCTGHPAHLPEE